MHPDPARLATVPLFAGLSEDDRGRLASWIDVERFDAGKHVAREGSAGYVFFVIDEGSVRVEHTGHVLTTLGPGDVFGEMAFFADDGRRKADVIAETDVTLWSMFGIRFREMEMAHPDVTARLRDLVRTRAEALAQH